MTMIKIFTNKMTIINIYCRFPFGQAPFFLRSALCLSKSFLYQNSKLQWGHMWMGTPQ